MTSSYTGQSSSLTSHLREEASNFGGSTSQLGLPEQGSFSGSASTPVSFNAEVSISFTPTVPNSSLVVESSTTNSSSANTYLQIPSDDD